jgi:hypothetical protein
LTGTGVAVTSNDRYFSIKVWDTTLEGTDNEDEQLSDFTLLAVRIENEDTRPPITQLYDLNPKAESTLAASVSPTVKVGGKDTVQNTTKGSLYMAGGKISGHIEPRDGIGNGADIDMKKANIWLEYELDEDGYQTEETPRPTGFAKDTVSGIVTLKGRAQDDQRITAIYLDFGGNARLKILGEDTVTTSETYGQLIRADSLTADDVGLYQELSIDGHIVEWTYRWNTGTLIGGVTTATLGDVTVTVRAEDASASSGNGGLSESRANTADNADYNSIELTLAPYITTLTRFKNSSGVGDADKAPVLRSKNGWFSFRRSKGDAERMQIEGFNLAGTNQSVSIKGTSGGTVTPNGNYYYIEIPADATSGIVTYKAGTNSIEAVNNRNNNANSWNTSQEAIAGNEASALWNDDRAVHLFDSHNLDSGDNQGHFRDPTKVGSIVKPAMTIDPATGRLWASWSSYMINSAAVDNTDGGGTGNVFMPMYFSHNGGIDSPANARPVSWDMDPSEDTDIAWNTTDSRRSIVYLANYMTSGYNDGGLSFWDNGNGSRGMAGDLAHTSGDSTYTPPTGKVIERFNNIGNGHLLQFINPRIANNGNVSHIAYYDAKYRLLRYWNTNKENANGSSDSPGIVIEGVRPPVNQSLTFATDASVQGGWNKTDEGGFFRQGADYREVKTGDEIGRLRKSEDSGSTLYARMYAPYDGTITFLQPNGIVQADTPVVAIMLPQSADALDAGNYNAIDVNSAGIPVIAYLVQDKTAGTEVLRYAYGNAADATTFETADISMSGSNISTAGRYVSMRIDKDTADGRLNVMHITFMDSENGDLVYIKGTPNGTSGAYTFAAPVVIDSVGNVGKWADIAIDADGNPVISYLDQGGIDSRTGLKMAFYDPANGGNGWEYVTLPGRYAVNDVRTQVECDPRTIAEGRSWDAAFAYVSGDYYRISYYVK